MTNYCVRKLPKNHVNNSILVIEIRLTEMSVNDYYHMCISESYQVPVPTRISMTTHQKVVDRLVALGLTLYKARVFSALRV